MIQAVELARAGEMISKTTTEVHQEEVVATVEAMTAVAEEEDSVATEAAEEADMVAEVASVAAVAATETEMIIVEVAVEAAVVAIGTMRAGVVIRDMEEVAEVDGDKVGLELKVSPMEAAERTLIAIEVVIVDLVVVAAAEEGEDKPIKISVSSREDPQPALTALHSPTIMILSLPMELKKSKSTSLVTQLESISAI